MAKIYTDDDIAALLHDAFGHLETLVVVEHTHQPEDVSPRFGWDFMAPDDARQFHVEVGGETALLTLDAAGGDLVLDIPAQSCASELVPRLLASIADAVAGTTKARTLRARQGRKADALSVKVLGLAATSRAGFAAP